MNAKELRKLDAFIAEHVFNIRVIKKKFANKRYPWGYKLSDGKNEWPNANGLHGWGWSHDEKGARFHTPHYTTDPAAAMAVLEKCCEKLASFDVCIWKGATGPLWYCGERKFTCDITMFSKAPTLPLAIALFAKQLFSKKD